MDKVMDKVLEHAGMAQDTDKPEPVICKHCNNEKPQIQIKHPFKNELRWVNCVCPCEVERDKQFKQQQANKAKQRRINQVLRLSSPMGEMRNMRFDSFLSREGAENAKKEIVHAVRNFKDRGKLGVFLLGETGNGKTHLTAAGGNALLQRGYTVIFITEKDLFSRLLATKDFRNKESFQEIMEACLQADLLIWDDFLSSQRLSNEEKDWTFQIINGRERAGKPIWATSNLTPEEFQSNDIAYRLDDKGRTWWRILGNMNVVENQAKNYRKDQAIERVKYAANDKGGEIE